MKISQDQSKSLLDPVVFREQAMTIAVVTLPTFLLTVAGIVSGVVGATHVH